MRFECWFSSLRSAIDCFEVSVESSNFVHFECCNWWWSHCFIFKSYHFLCVDLIYQTDDRALDLINCSDGSGQEDYWARSSACLCSGESLTGCLDWSEI